MYTYMYTHVYTHTQHDFTSKECIELATERSSFAFMKEHQFQFDEKLSKQTRNEACGLPKDAGMDATKLKEGTSGHGKLVLSDEIRAAIMAKWMEVVAPVTGCKTYSDLREQLSKESNNQTTPQST